MWRHTAFSGIAGNSAIPMSRVSGLLVLHWGDNPTVDHYFRHSQVHGIPVYGCIDISRAKNLPDVDKNVVVVIVRYTSPAVLKWLKHHRARGGAVAFFMDDDLPSNLYDTSLPWRYRLKLWRFFGRHLRQLETLCNALWVSTPTLMERYTYASPLKISPIGLATPPAPSAKTTYFYHGSPSTHRSDIEWLQFVVRLTQAASDDLVFMIVGDKQVRRLFAGLPRTLILHPLSWPNYRDALPSLPHHIGLAPLVPTAFNATRSPTRFYDFTHLGAVGLYSDTQPYRSFIQHGLDGYLLPNDPQVWSEHIIQLASQPHLRASLLQAAQQRITQ